MTERSRRRNPIWVALLESLDPKKERSTRERMWIVKIRASEVMYVNPSSAYELMRTSSQTTMSPAEYKH
jgi:hypothetical protein